MSGGHIFDIKNHDPHGQQARDQAQGEEIAKDRFVFAEKIEHQKGDDRPAHLARDVHHLVKTEGFAAFSAGVGGDQAVFGRASDRFAQAFHAADDRDIDPVVGVIKKRLAQRGEGIAGHDEGLGPLITVAQVAEKDPKRVGDKGGDRDHVAQLVHPLMQDIDDKNRQDRSDHAARHIGEEAHPPQRDDVFVDVFHSPPLKGSAQQAAPGAPLFGTRKAFDLPCWDRRVGRRRSLARTSFRPLRRKRTLRPSP